MKRLIKKSAQTFVHATSLDRLESILNQGLLPGQENGQFTGDSLMNREGIYVSDSNIKGERLNSIDDFGSVLLELSLDTENMIPDPEYFNTSGPHPLSTSDIMNILEFVVDSDLFQQKYASKLNINDYDDIDEFIDEEYDTLTELLISSRDNYELAKLLKPGMFYELTDYVYLGSVSPTNITRVYISNQNNEIGEFDPNNKDEIFNFINENH